MDGFLFDWSEGDDDGFFGEDDDVVNKNDPFRRDRDEFSPYELDPTDLDEAKQSRFEGIVDALDDVDVADAAAAASILGGMYEEEVDDLDWVDQEIEKISLRQASAAGKSDGSFPKRPFEQWVDECLNGKRSWDDY